MKVLQVIHGYPPRYSAGSEIYTQAISHQLVRSGHEVEVFTREESAFRPDYALRDDQDADVPAIRLHIVNIPRSRERYQSGAVDSQFLRVVREFNPDVVHVGHLNHLSTSIVDVANRDGLPVILTLHDFWLMCPRGQFMQYNLDGPEPWASCDGQEDHKCARRCYSRYFGGASRDEPADLLYWTGWVHRRMEHVRDMARKVNLFIAPARSLRQRFLDEFGLSAERTVYLDYGFDLRRLGGRSRRSEPDFVFGYIGTHRPAKGIHVLLQAFAQLRGATRLRIWGRTVSDTTPSLKEQARGLPGDRIDRIEWMGEYGTATIVQDVFDRVDALVVPSIWPENSPLVIHEAQQARVPVITSDLGGMAEYVHHEENGLLFTPRDPRALAAQMQRLATDPPLAERLGARGYLYSSDGSVPSIEEHVDRLVSFYEQARPHAG